MSLLLRAAARGVAVLLLAAAPLAAQPTAPPLFPGLTGEALRDAVRGQFSPTSTYSYDRARDSLFASVYQAVDDSLHCVYTRYAVFLPAGENPTQAACNGDGDDNPSTCSNIRTINTEHVWPQSMGAGSGSARSDMHHLFPSRSDANNGRGNYPFATVEAALASRWYYRTYMRTTPPPPETQHRWSRTRNMAGNPFGGRFEPPDDRKGDIARAIFYFAAIYPGNVTAANAWGFFDVMKDELLAWHRADPPDAEERLRSQRVAMHQGRENPFVLDTSLVRRAFFDGDSGSLPPLPPPTAWLNEIHYNNTGADVGEFVEIAVRDLALYRLDDFRVHLYRSNGTMYRTISFAPSAVSGPFDDVSLLVSVTAPIQDDGTGLALAWQGDLIEGQFLSWGGTVTATEGPATGRTSVPLGVVQPNSTPIGHALQLLGTADGYGGFSWAAVSAPQTPGLPNHVPGLAPQAFVRVGERLFTEGDGQRGAAGWRALGAPVRGVTPATLAAQNLVQGLPEEYPEAGVNLYALHAGQQAWRPVRTAAAALPPGLGFIWYLWDDTFDPGLPSGTSTSRSLDAFTLTATGPHAAFPFGWGTEAPVAPVPGPPAPPGAPQPPGTLAPPFAGGAGQWSLLANPWPDPVDAGALVATGGDIQDALQLYDPLLGDFRVLDRTDAPTERLLAPWQGVFVENSPTAPASGLLLPLTAKAPAAVPEAVRPAVRHRLVVEVLADDRPAGAAVEWRFEPGAAVGPDPVDAGRLAPLDPATVALALAPPDDERLLLRDARPLPTEPAVTLLYVSGGATAPEALVLRWPVVDLPPTLAATLVDLETGAEVDLASASEYAFTLGARGAGEPLAALALAPERAGLARFSLHVAPRTSTTEGGASAALRLHAPFPNPTAGAANVTLELDRLADVQVVLLDALGRRVRVLADRTLGPGTHTLAADLHDLAAGVYFVQAVAGGERLTQPLTRR